MGAEGQIQYTSPADHRREPRQQGALEFEIKWEPRHEISGCALLLAVYPVAHFYPIPSSPGHHLLAHIQPLTGYRAGAPPCNLRLGCEGFLAQG